MSFDLDETHAPLIHVHVCVHCGSAFRSEEFEDQAQTTGVYPCPKCGKASPLNIEIRAEDAPESSVGEVD